MFTLTWDITQVFLLWPSHTCSIVMAMTIDLIIVHLNCVFLIRGGRKKKISYQHSLELVPDIQKDIKAELKVCLPDKLESKQLVCLFIVCVFCVFVCMSVHWFLCCETEAHAVFYPISVSDMWTSSVVIHSMMKSTCCRNQPRRASLPGTSTEPFLLMTILRTPTAMDRILCTRSARWHLGVISVYNTPEIQCNTLPSSLCLSVC